MPVTGGTIEPPKNNYTQINATTGQKLFKKGIGRPLNVPIRLYPTQAYRASGLS